MISEWVQRQMNRLLDEAEQAIARRDWASVGDRAQAALNLDADNTDARAYLAAAERALGITAKERPESYGYP